MKFEGQGSKIVDVKESSIQGGVTVRVCTDLWQCLAFIDEYFSDIYFHAVRSADCVDNADVTNDKATRTAIQRMTAHSLKESDNMS